MMRIDRSRLGIQCLGGAAWTIGAGVCAVWMLHGGGLVKPLTSFLGWATAMCFIEFMAMEENPARTPVSRIAKKALRYGAFSVLGVALGTLFLEYWPVTVSMAFMFAICRSFKDQDSPAYI